MITDIKVLFGTTNQSKRDRIQRLFTPLGLEICSLKDLGITVSATEDSETAEGNAVKKSEAYFLESGIPTFSVDYALRVEKFQASSQPGTHVRRIQGYEREVTDEELLDWFIAELKAVGGESLGTWHCGIAIALSETDVRSATYTTDTLFMAERSPVSMPGEPLNSIQYDTRQGKYKSERTPEEWVESNNEVDLQMVEFMREAIGKGGKG